MNNIMRLAQGRTLVEQLRLLLGNVGSSAIPAILLALLLVWVLSKDINALALKLWCAAVILSKLYCTYDARRILASDISFDHARHLVWRLLVLNAIDGMAWGTLAWITMDTTSVAGSVLVVAVLAGIAGSSMSLHAEA